MHLAGLRASLIGGSDSCSDACEHGGLLISHDRPLYPFIRAPPTGGKRITTPGTTTFTCVSSRRCPVSSTAAGSRSPATAAKPQYAALYELSAHPDAVMAAMNEGINNGTVHMSDAVDLASISMTTLTPR